MVSRWHQILASLLFRRFRGYNSGRNPRGGDSSLLHQRDPGLTVARTDGCGDGDANLRRGHERQFIVAEDSMIDILGLFRLGLSSVLRFTTYYFFEKQTFRFNGMENKVVGFLFFVEKKPQLLQTLYL